MGFASVPPSETLYEASPVRRLCPVPRSPRPVPAPRGAAVGQKPPLWKEGGKPSGRPPQASAFQGDELLTGRRRPGRSGDFGPSLLELGCSRPWGSCSGRRVWGAASVLVHTLCPGGRAVSSGSLPTVHGSPATLRGQVPRAPGPRPPLPGGKLPARECSLRALEVGDPAFWYWPSSCRGSGERPSGGLEPRVAPGSPCLVSHMASPGVSVSAFLGEQWSGG